MKSAQFHWKDDTDIKSVFRICCSDNLKPMLPHSHREVELMYFYDTDDCRYTRADEIIRLKSKDLMVVDSGEVHACNHWGRNCYAVCVMIDLKKLHNSTFSRLRFSGKISDNEEITKLFDKIKSILVSDIEKNEKECLINGALYNVLYELLKYSRPISDEEDEYRQARDLSAVYDYIEDNLSEKITVKRLAEISYLSADRFYHVFKESVGISPTEYVTIRRIEKACEYLESTQMTITEIAQECNFCTSSYFCEKFKRYMKITPKRYRKRFLTAIDLRK